MTSAMIPTSIEEAIHLVCVGHYGHQVATARAIMRRCVLAGEDNISTDALRQRLNAIGHGDDISVIAAIKLIIAAEDASNCFAFSEYLFNRATIKRMREHIQRQEQPQPNAPAEDKPAPHIISFAAATGQSIRRAPTPEPDGNDD